MPVKYNADGSLDLWRLAAACDGPLMWATEREPTFRDIVQTAVMVQRRREQLYNLANRTHRKALLSQQA